MEVPSYKLNASLRGVLAQRLLRMVCPECSVERPINDQESRLTGLPIGMSVRFANALTAEDKQNERQREHYARAAEEQDTKVEWAPMSL